MRLDQVFGVLLILLAIYLAVNATGGPDPLDIFDGDPGIGDAEAGDGDVDAPPPVLDDGDDDVRRRTGRREQVVTGSDFCAAAPGSSPYTDLGGEHDAAIRCMDEAGVVTGVSRRRYAPGDAVTRAQAAAYIVAMVDEANRLEAPGVNLRDVPASDNTQFRDVDEESPHHEAIQRLDQTPILQGYVDLRYEPEGSVTRAQMASILDRAYRYMNDAALPIGPDRFRDDEQSVHEESINALAAAGIMPGVDDDRFAPGRSVLRGQMASYLARMMVRMEEKGRIRPLQ